MTDAFTNRIATALPPHDVHERFIDFARKMLKGDSRRVKLARHIVRSEPGGRVLAMNLEPCTLRLHEATDLEEILSFLLLSDGCAAALISADPVGLRMDTFQAALVPDTAELIRWNIRELGFDMVLSGGVLAAIRSGLSQAHATFLNKEAPIDLWALRPDGRTVLDAVEASLELPPSELAMSRGILSDLVAETMRFRMAA